MKLNPKVSVIIPTYNRAHTLKRAIDSVLAQSYKNIELIVVNDGSSDSTQKLLASYTNIHIKNISNHGVSFARNKGIDIATGEYIAFLDSDDEWLAHKIETQMSFLASNPDIHWIHGHEIWIRDGVRVNQMKKHKKGGGDQFLASLKLCVISPSTVLIKREVLDEHKFREDFPVCEDYDLWLRLTHKFPIGYIEEPLIKKYGGHSDQLSRSLVGMDYFRIKALDSLLLENILEESQAHESQKVLIKKLNILYQGCVKHNNSELLQKLSPYVFKYRDYIS